MFYDGVFDNLDGMKFVSPGEFSLSVRVPKHSSHSAFCGPGRTVLTHPVPIEMFMDYVPDIAAFKVLNFKGADSYICVVRPLLLSRPPELERLAHPTARGAHRASSRGRSNSTCRSSRH